MHFPVTVSGAGNPLIEIVEDSLVAVVKDGKVKLNYKNPLNDDPKDFQSVTLTTEQLLALAVQVRDM